MATFFGHPVHPICRLVIFFVGLFGKQCFRRSAGLRNLKLRISEEINAISALENLNVDEDVNRACENIKESIKTSAKESLGLHKLKR